MRVLVTTDTVGGVWTFTQELCAGLLERGDQVSLVSAGQRPKAKQWAWIETMRSQWSEAFAFEAVQVPLEWMQENEGSMRDAVPQLLAVVTRFAPEVIHANQFCFGALPCATPRLVTAHSDVLSWARACRSSGLEETPWLERYRLLVQGGLSAAQAVVAPTHWMLAALESNFRLPEQAEVIPNGRSLPEGAAVPRKLQAITAGRLWDEAKDVALLEHVTAPMPLLVAGETAHEGARVPPLGSHVQLLGSLDEEALLQLFRASAIYICTSRYEPFGLAPLEAAACGCALLLQDIPSLREVWGDTALFFQGAASLSELLQGMCDEPQRLLEAQRRVQARARRYGRGRMTEAYRSLYERVLRSAGELSDVA